MRPLVLASLCVAAVCALSTTARAQAPTDPEIEVLVEADPPRVGATEVTSEDAKQVPGSFGDPIRAIEARPGVAPIFSGTPYFFVRGAPPGNVGYFFDGIPIPLLFHAAFGPSVLPASLIDRVDFHPGAFPARYGRYAGAVVTAQSRPAIAAWHGEANLRVLDAGGLVEAPFAEGRGTALVAGRYSYSSSLISDLLGDVSYDYWDYQGRVGYDLTGRDRIEAFAFGSSDFLSTTIDLFGDSETVLDTRFQRLDLRYDHRLAATSHLRAAVTLGLDRSRGNDQDFGDARRRSIRARTEVEHDVGEHTVRTGADVVVGWFDVTPPTNPDDLATFLSVTRNFTDRTDIATGAYLDATFRASDRVTVEPGLRFDVFGSQGDTRIGVDPRLSATFELSERARTIVGAGMSHQPPSFPVPVPALQLAGLSGGLQRGVQTSSGLEVDWPRKVRSRVTVFQNAVFDGSDQLSLTQIGVTESYELDERAFGRTVGVELLVERPLTTRLGGMVSYTLSRSLRSYERFVGPGGFDRTHVVNAAASYDFGRGWRLGSRILAYSGAPAEVDTFDLARDPPRTKPFYRVDLRGEKRWVLRPSRVSVSLVAEVLNLTANREEVNLQCDDFGCVSDELGPLTIPSVGVEVRF